MPKRRAKLRWFLVIFLPLSMCTLAVASGLLAGYIPDLIADLGSPATWLRPHERLFLTTYLLLSRDQLRTELRPDLPSVDLVVAEGATASEVALQLMQAGMIENPDLLVNYLRYRGLDRGIEAGNYSFAGDLTLIELGQALQSASSDESLFTVPEGWRREQIAEALGRRQSSIGAEEFLQVSSRRPSSYSFSGELPAEGGLEGFLFPDSYRLDAGTQALDLVTEMLDTFEMRVTPIIRLGFERQGLTIYRAVTLASIVEREAVVADERPQIASVFINRLALGMRLDADPTVQYALGLQPDGSWWKGNLTFGDLEFESPYNTYLYAGLPPTPISNPGLSSLQAVAEPAQTVYLYFRAECDGSGRHRFAVSFEEHVANACP
jgi:UPF0755 protein